MYCSLCVRRYKLYVENLNNNETETEIASNHSTDGAPTLMETLQYTDNIPTVLSIPHSTEFPLEYLWYPFTVLNMHHSTKHSSQY